jgi:hypothetical protein
VSEPVLLPVVVLVSLASVIPGAAACAPALLLEAGAGVPFAALGVPEPALVPLEVPPVP